MRYTLGKVGMIPKEPLAKLNKTDTPAKDGVRKTLKGLDSCVHRNEV
jgi:hypothetical protein